MRMSWLEIDSPTLKHHHLSWVGLRGLSLLPGMATYKNFTEIVPTNFSASLILPADNSSPVWGHVGNVLEGHLPQCRPGLRVEAMPSESWRASVLSPILKVAATRQPDCRRGQFGQNKVRFERLLLPFADTLRVRVVHIIYDIPGYA